MANPVKLGQLDPTPSPQSVTDNPRITTEWMDSVSTVIEQLKFAIQGILGNPQAELLSSAAMSDLSDSTPVTLTPDITATAGTGNKGSRFDHVHNVPAAVVSDLDATNTSSAEGAAATFARSDHDHKAPTAAGGAVVVGATGAVGSATTLARSDHTHTLAVGTAQDVGNANSAGSSGTFLHADHVHDLGTAGDTNYLRRDGGNDITGTLVPDSDGGQSLGSSALHFDVVNARQFGRTVANDTETVLVACDRSGTTGGINIQSDGVGAWSAETPNAWQAAAIPAVSPATLALEGITSLDELAACAAAYDMDGNTFTDLGGCTSSNAAVLTFTSDLTGSSGVNGINLTWDEGTTESSNEWITSLRYNDGSSTEDKFKFGFHNQPAATAQNTMYIPVGTGNTEGFSLSCGDDAAGLANVDDANNCGFTMYPSFASGSMWFYVGGTNVLQMQKSGPDIIVRDDLNTNFSFKTTVAIRSVNAGTSHNNGWFQTGFSSNRNLTAGWLRIEREGINVTSASASANHTNALWGVDYQGVIHTGHFGDFDTAPEDGGCGAAGWTDTSQNADQTGSDFVIFGGVGTGDSDVKGDIIFQTPDAGGSGTAPQSLTTKATLYREGDLAVQGFDSNIVNIDDTDSPYTILDTDNTIICDATNGAITVTLPAVASTTTGRRYNVKKIDNSANNVTVDGNGAETVDDATTQVITAQYDSITVQSDGSEWWVI